MNKTIKTLKQIIASRRAARHIVSSRPQMPLEAMPDPTVKAPAGIPPMSEVAITDVHEEAPEAADVAFAGYVDAAETEAPVAEETEEKVEVAEDEDSTKSSRKRKKKKSKS